MSADVTSRFVLTDLELPSDCIDLWLVPGCDDIGAMETAAGHYLSVDERARLQDRRLPKGQAMFLLTRIVLRRLLTAYEPSHPPESWQFDRGSSGRPRVSSPEGAPAFNLSHSDDMLLLAFSRTGTPGVDVESIGRELDPLALAGRYFSELEVAQMRALSPGQQHDRFLALWTLKEACVKANGQGLARALRSFQFDFTAGMNLSADALESPPHQHWKLWSFMLDERLRIALALRGAALQSCRVRVWQLHWPDRLQALELSAQYQFSH